MHRNLRRQEFQYYEESVPLTYCQLCDYQAESNEGFLIHKDKSEVHLYNFLTYQYQRHRKRESKNPRHGVCIDTYCDAKEIEVTADGTVKLVVIKIDFYDFFGLRILFLTFKKILASFIICDNTAFIGTGLGNGMYVMCLHEFNNFMLFSCGLYFKSGMISPNREKVVYEFIVRNTLKNEMHLQLTSAMLLHPYLAFSIQDEKGISSNKQPLLLTPGSTYKVQVTFKNCGIGSYGVPVRFELIREDLPKKCFFISRMMVVNVTETEELEKVDLKDNPFLGESWTGMEVSIPGTMPNGQMIKRHLEYDIPTNIFIVLKNGLIPFDGMGDELITTLYEILSMLSMPFPQDLASYVEFFHTLLYMEEFFESEQLEKYNMTNIPGLAEKRPSVLPGDLIYMRVSDADGYECIQYEAVVAEVRDTVVWIGGFDSQLMYRLLTEGKLHFDIRFTVNRFSMFVTHRALDILLNLGFSEIVFPEDSLYPPLQVNGPVEFYNSRVANNPEQRKAVMNIVQGTSRPSAFILHGPPGTGKTVTIVEAILQIKKMFKKSHILVCAPSNAACDLLARRLAPHCTTSELLRLHSSSRDWDTVPTDIHKYSNRDAQELEKYRIIVCTLISSGRLLPNNFRNDDFRPTGHFTHVFIDECGQASEPASLIPQAGILSEAHRNKPGGQVILSGDPEQLGPVCVTSQTQLITSKTEGNPHPLEMSLMERLMKTCYLYSQRRDGTYDDRYIVKLCRNFRSHPQVLILPNRLIYENMLVACCGSETEFDTVKNLMKDPKLNQSVIFHGILGQEKREGRSPSFYNTYEMQQVMWYVGELLKGGENRTPVPQSDIGIIAPYIRQVYKLKAKLKQNKMSDVEVGTTETFQGREKRVIIISTVRSNRNLLDYDKKYGLGFVANKKRFNVAITRARSLLIVIGNPHLLDRDENWDALIHFTQDIGSYRGCAYTPRRSPKWMNYVVEQLKCYLNEN
ncbi:hypothetical protein C0J52_25288 [Blattella germanica]|nr:hypothetical protein C0J52_25288 [Blattella germanica]